MQLFSSYAAKAGKGLAECVLVMEFGRYKLVMSPGPIMAEMGSEEEKQCVPQATKSRG